MATYERPGSWRVRLPKAVSKRLGLHCLELTNSDAVAGVSADLPDAPFEATQPVLNYYKRLPVLRKLDWREDDNGQPIRRELANTRTLIAGYVQTRGRLAETPCTFCTQGKGIWQECVIGSDTQDERPMTKACANCRFSGRSACNLREYCPLLLSGVIADRDNGDRFRFKLLSEPRSTNC
jgi:hypothetical protein